MDSDCAGEKNSRKSTTGFTVLVNDTPVARKNHRQSIVSFSLAEAE